MWNEEIQGQQQPWQEALQKEVMSNCRSDSEKYEENDCEHEKETIMFDPEGRPDPQVWLLPALRHAEILPPLHMLSL